MSVIFSIDAETVGLYEQPFAIAYTVTDLTGRELRSGYLACPAENAQGLPAGRQWVNQHVLPQLPPEAAYQSPQELCEAIYQIWLQINQEYAHVYAIADFHYPVETHVFAQAIQTDTSSRQLTGPYPLHEVATALLIAGIDRTHYPRQDHELPEHHPLKDARYAARLFLLALQKTAQLRLK